MRGTSSALADSPSNGPDGLAPPSGALEAAVWTLEVVPPHQRRRVLRHEAAVAVDRLLARVARSRGALDVGLCEGLAALGGGDRTLRLGFSGIGDYARQRLGVAARTAQAMARLGKALGERPLLRAAVRAGLVSQRAAQVVLPVATGEAEAGWVALAGRETVRGLAVAMKAQLDAAGRQARGPEADAGAAGAPPDGPAQLPDLSPADALGADPAGASAPGTSQDDDDAPGEAWQRVAFPVTAAARETLEAALEAAGRVLGEGAPRWQRLEGLAQEYLGAHPSEPGDAAAVAGMLADWGGDARGPLAAASDQTQPLAWPTEGWRAELEAALESETRRWAWLDAVRPVAAPMVVGDGRTPAELDASLRALASLRIRWDALLGHLALLLRMLGLWREAGFASFGHYCRERLGLGVRGVEQRIALERRLHLLPAVRAALGEGRLSTEQARLVARVATERTMDGWVARAAERPCLTLQREVEALDLGGEVVVPPWEPLIPPGYPGAGGPRAAQVCAPETLRLRVPVPVASLLAGAFQAARRVEGRRLEPCECLERVAAHFLAVWGGLPRGRGTPQRRALRRDGHRCQVPACSRAAVHAHHVLYRAHGGSDRLENLVSLCAAHHLHGIHRGWVRVHGLAPDGLSWQLGVGQRGCDTTSHSSPSSWEPACTYSARSLPSE